jgi:hypothetical protein
MNPMGVFKVMLWLAPVLALLFFYITQMQQTQVDDMKVEFSKFDEDFAAMSEGLSTGAERDHWAGAKAEAGERYEKAKAKAAESTQKQADTFSTMEQELMSTNSDELIGAHAQ